MDCRQTACPIGLPRIIPPLPLSYLRHPLAFRLPEPDSCPKESGQGHITRDQAYYVTNRYRNGEVTCVSKSGNPDPKLVAELRAMLSPDGRKMLDNIQASGSQEQALIQVARACGMKPEELTRLLQEPKGLEQLLTSLLTGAGPQAGEVAQLLQQSGLLKQKPGR